jgi:signal transduction histidine kinase
MDLNEILHARGDIAESRVSVNLTTLVKEVQGSVSVLVRNSGAVIEFDFAAARELRSIRSYMNSIFYNLITNSIKFARPGQTPLIKIWTEQREASVIIYYQDNSLGIDLDKHREKVFRLYQRFHIDIEGKGLGLYMTKTQVEALGGTITVDSTPDKGCLFAITLPY